VLGFAPDTAIADAGYMVRHCDLIDLARDTSRSGVAFMPHITAARFADGLRRVCHDLGYTYVDPREPLETILAAIAGAELLVTEALHGAVIADAYRTPWLPVRSSGAIQELKWRDFTGAIGVDYRPLDVRIRWRFRPRRGPRILATLESLLLSAGAALGRLAVSERDTALDLLRAGSSPPLLSDADRLAQIDERIHDKLETLRTAWRSGTLFTSRDG
jgi:succinoglycan biosynthesis protein ExoV